jgi:large subunit ribosomal protein L24
MIGKFKGQTGKIERVNLKKGKVVIEGIQRKKKDGSKINVFFNASNLQVQKLNLDDKKRIKSISRKKAEKPKQETKQKENAPNKKSVK